MYKKQFVSILAAVLAAVSMAGCQEALDTEQAELTSSEVQQTTSDTEQITSISETEAETSVDTDNSSETVSENEDTSFETDSEETFSYAEITFTPDCYSQDHIDQPMLIESPEGSGVNVYVMIGNESKKWTHYSHLSINDDGMADISEYVIIEHDGIIDEMPCKWGQRFGDPFSIYSGDYDGDGEFEIAAVRYATGGTFCNINELTIFKKIGGHYQQFLLDNADMLKKYISHETDVVNNTVKFMVNGYNTNITIDIDDPEHFHGISYGDIVGFSVDGDKITTKIVMVMHGQMLNDIAELTMTVNFADGEFTCTDPVFELLEE